MRTGDVVLHRPSGEKWLVAMADEADIMPCGWPETVARVSDCEIVTAADDAEHIKVLREVARSRCGVRAHRCAYILSQLDAAYAAAAGFSPGSEALIQQPKWLRDFLIAGSFFGFALASLIWGLAK